jgi:hypothetical protein
MLAFKTEDLFKRPEVRQYCFWSALVYLICTRVTKRTLIGDHDMNVSRCPFDAAAPVLAEEPIT